jgi:hypothetical protein
MKKPQPDQAAAFFTPFSIANHDHSTLERGQKSLKFAAQSA